MSWLKNHIFYKNRDLSNLDKDQKDAAIDMVMNRKQILLGMDIDQKLKDKLVADCDDDLKILS